ncbi:hypothetical protein MNBD_GAMMA11-270, partial [hydrothermal vent metagenome]
MFIEIRKTGFLNKGAELMLYATLDKIKKKYPCAKYVMETNRTAPYEKRALLGLYQKISMFRMGVQLGRLVYFVPEVIRKRLGIVLDKEISVVLDAAGFSYSDQQGERAALELSDTCQRMKKKGAKIILLPQAFGPFKQPKIRKAIKIMVENTELVFAREKISYDYLIDVVGECDNVKIAPDFTNLIEGVLPLTFDMAQYRFCLVPNCRMIDKTGKKQGEAYISFMANCARYLIEKNAKPFMLVHEGEKDMELAECINALPGVNIPVLQESDALKIKGILSLCEGTVGSRYHGLVSALCQGVPALATGWSHKYQVLFDDYGFSEGLLDVTCSVQELHKKLDLILEDKSRKKIKQTIEKKSKILKEQSI